MPDRDTTRLNARDRLGGVDRMMRPFLSSFFNLWPNRSSAYFAPSDMGTGRHLPDLVRSSVVLMTCTVSSLMSSHFRFSISPRPDSGSLTR